MTITDRAPWDYRSRAPIVSDEIQLCLMCAGSVALRASGKVACLRCDSERFVTVMEHQAAAMRFEIRKANRLVASQQAVTAQARRLREEREQIEAEAAGVQEWLGADDLDYSDDRPSAGMREHRP